MSIQDSSNLPSPTARKNLQSIALIRTLIESSGLPPIHSYQAEPFNTDYEALRFSSADNTFRSRLAKKTPKKDGYFLTPWTKNAEGTNIPFIAEEFCDYLLVFIIDENHQGYFSFPREELARRGVLTNKTQKGKMAFRVSPDWCLELNPSAKREQKWQQIHWRSL